MAKINDGFVIHLYKNCDFFPPFECFEKIFAVHFLLLACLFVCSYCAVFEACRFCFPGCVLVQLFCTFSSFMHSISVECCPNSFSAMLLFIACLFYAFSTLCNFTLCYSTPIYKSNLLQVLPCLIVDFDLYEHYTLYCWTVFVLWRGCAHNCPTNLCFCASFDISVHPAIQETDALRVCADVSHFYTINRFCSIAHVCQCRRFDLKIMIYVLKFSLKANKALFAEK